jgi:iron complex outermembrane receptor protein
VLSRKVDRKRVGAVARIALALWIGGVVGAAGATVAQSWQGRVLDGQGQPVAGAEVEAVGGGRVLARASTDREGRFALAVEPGALPVKRIRARADGRRPAEVSLSEAQPPGELTLVLLPVAFEQEIVVTSALPELLGEQSISGTEVRRVPRPDVASALRDQEGVSAIRRGGVNLEPEVRGLQETQVALLVDGTRTAAAGPARMDSGISHVSPLDVERIAVVKGPYALSWGPGALSAVQVETFRPEFSGDGWHWDGRLRGGYAEGTGTVDAGAAVSGASDRFRFYLSQSDRSGDDYEAGDGSLVPGDYASAETRWLFGLRPATGWLLELSGGYQHQSDLDYPGRLLDATYFYTRSHSAELTWKPEDGRLHELYVQAYVNDKDHRMNNDEKPTAQPMPGRTPPFALDVAVVTSARTTGGRAWTLWDAGAVSLKAGVDLLRIEQDADRTVARRDNGFVIFEDVVWPDVRLDHLGGYLQAAWTAGGARFGAVVRLDRFDNAAGRPSPFFLANTQGPLDGGSTDLSGAVSAEIDLAGDWVLTAGAGRAVRTPTALELYSDRFPSTKFQLAAEFLGNPQLAPEISTELDLGTAGRLGPVALRIEGFYRVIDDYITVQADPSVARRLPLSPPTVYRYVNGDRATFSGGELTADASAGRWLYWRAGLATVRGEDETFNEPVLGLPPWTGRAALGVRAPAGRWWAEARATVTGDQNRVASQRFEVPTEGWTVFDLSAGFRLRDGLDLTVGVLNAGDEAYADHLNARNPFTGARILEPGRSAFATLDWKF